MAGYQLGALLGDSRVGVIFFVGAIDGGEDGLEAVIIGLGDGIELMIVALGALHREAVESLHGVHHHVVAIEVTRDLAVDLGFRHLLVADQIPGTGGDETEGFDAIACAGE